MEKSRPHVTAKASLKKELAGVIEAMPEAVVILDLEGRISQVNSEFERSSGWKREEVVGKTAIELGLVSEEEGQRIDKEVIPKLMKEGSVRNIEIIATRRDGTKFPGLLSLTLRKDAEGKPTNIVTIIRDITERKRAEKARIEQAAALAIAEELQRSRQRIITMQESLRKDIAQQLHGSVQNRIIVLLHLLRELERVAVSGGLAMQIADLRQKLGELLESDVRSISQRLYPSILRRGLIPALQSLGEQFEAAVAIDMELDEELMRQERANRELIPEQVRLAGYRIAEEALTNVVKHAKASRVTIGLGLSSEGWLCLTVRDNGQGFKVRRTSGRLGMLMMQDYAEVMGGKCIIRSTPGEGTEVTAILPLAGPGADHPQRASPLE